LNGATGSAGVNEDGGVAAAAVADEGTALMLLFPTLFS